MRYLNKITLFLILIFISVKSFSQDWITTASNDNPRMYHSITLLNDDRVIVVGGGFVGGDVAGIAEIYNPETDSWTETAELPVPVLDHATVCTSDSTIHVFGGVASGSSVDNVWEYNLNTDTWTQKTDMPIDIREHTATVLPDGKVLIAGGYRDPAYTDNPWSFVYDPRTDTYGANVNLLTTKTEHNATVLNNGTVMFTGGYNFNINPPVITDVEIYNPETETWTTQGEISVGRSGGQRAIKTFNGDVLVIGGYFFQIDENFNVVDKYDAETQTWSTLQNLPVKTTIASVALLENGNILIAGGLGETGKNTAQNINPKFKRRLNATHSTSNSKDTYYMDNVFSINPETGDQTTLTALPIVRSGAYAFNLTDNRILLMYGKSDVAVHNTNGEIYGTATTPFTYNVTFNVFENDGVTPINAASIQFNGETLETNAYGEITFTEAIAGNGLSFTVSKNGFANYTGGVTVSTNDINIDIVMEVSTVNIDNINSKKFTIYPNPSNGIFTIDFKTSVIVERSRNKGLLNVSITDITGKIINQTTTTCTERSRSVNLKNQPAGIYFLKIIYAERGRSNTKKEIFTQKIILN